MWRYLVFQPPLDNTLFDSGAVERLLDRRLIAWLWLANIIYIIVIVGIVALTYLPLEPDFRAIQLTYASLCTVIPITLVLLLVGIGASTLMFTLRTNITDAVQLTALPRHRLIEAVWATLVGQWPYLRLLSAGALAAFIAWFLRDVLLEAYNPITLLLLSHSLILILQFGCVINLMLLLGLVIGRGRTNLTQAALLGASAALGVCIIFFGVRFGLLNILITSQSIASRILDAVTRGVVGVYPTLMATVGELLNLVLLGMLTLVAFWLTCQRTPR